MIGIVVPCYNEGSRWNAAYWESVFEVPGIHWLFVDDGSSDGSARLLDETAALGDASVLHVVPNGGKADAVRRGMRDVLNEMTDVEAVGYMDADGAFNASDVADIVRVFRERVGPESGVSAVWSSRVALAGRNIKRTSSRHYIGRVIATVLSIGQEEIPYDTQSGLKLFAPSPTLSDCLMTPFRTRWLFELELLSRWYALTGGEMRIWEEPLNYWHDVPGSKIRGKEMVRIVREIAVVKQEQSRARRNRG